MPSQRRRLRVAPVAGALALAFLLASCAGTATGASSPVSSATTDAAPVDSAAASPFAADGLQDPRNTESEISQATPTRVSIPSLGVDSSLEDLAIDAEGRLAAPVDFDLAGWYTQGVRPGAIGPAIIAGHVDSPTAPAVFARVGELTPGAEVIVTMSEGDPLTFVVTGSTQSAKSNFPTSEVYSNVPTPQLRLITCAGVFDSSIGHYTDNLIVFAALRS